MNIATSPLDKTIYFSTLQLGTWANLRVQGAPMRDPEGVLSTLVADPYAVLPFLMADVANGKTHPLPVETFTALTTAIDAARGTEKFKAAKEAAPAWVPATFASMSREKATCIGRQIIGHDFDRLVADTFDAAVERVKAMLPDRFLAVHTTASVRKPDGSWCIRAYELLDRPATPEEWESRIKPHMRGCGEHDENALDISRLLFLPLPVEGYRYHVVEGPRTSLDNLPIVTSSSATSSAPAPATPAVHAPEQTRVAAANLLGMNWPAEGNRHGAQLALAGALRHDIERKRLDWTKDDALEFLCDVCRIAGDEDRPKREATIEHTWSASEFTGWRTLESYVNVAIVSAAKDMLRGSYVTSFDEEVVEQLASSGDVAPANDAAPAVEPMEQDPIARAFTTAFSRKSNANHDAWQNAQKGGWHEPLPALPWLVEGLLPESKVTMVFAEPGAMKSWITISLLIAVSKGESWLGSRHVEQAPTFFVDYEDGKYEFQRRVQLQNGGRAAENLHYIYQPGMADSPSFWIGLTRYCLQHGVKFVVVDTIGGAAVGVDENATTAAVPLQMAGLCTELTGAHVMFTHHANKEGEIRGTSAFKANVDTLFRLRRPDKEKDVVELECVKSGQKKTQKLTLELTDDGLRIVEPEEKNEEQDKKEKPLRDEDLGGLVLLEIEKAEHAGEPISSKSRLRALIRDHGKVRNERVDAWLDEHVAKGHVRHADGAYVRDDDSKRWRRVQAVLLGGSHATPTQLAAAAAVDVSYVKKLLSEKRIRENVKNDRDAEGYHEIKPGDEPVEDDLS